MNNEPLLTRLKRASSGEMVWRVMIPDGTDYVIEFSHFDSDTPKRDAIQWLQEHNARGVYLGYYVEAVTLIDSKDRLIHEAIAEIKRLQKLEQGFQESIQMRTRE